MPMKKEQQIQITGVTKGPNALEQMLKSSALHLSPVRSTEPKRDATLIPPLNQMPRTPVPIISTALGTRRNRSTAWLQRVDRDPCRGLQSPEHAELRRSERRARRRQFRDHHNGARSARRPARAEVCLSGASVQLGRWLCWQQKCTLEAGKDNGLVRASCRSNGSLSGHRRVGRRCHHQYGSAGDDHLLEPGGRTPVWLQRRGDHREIQSNDHPAGSLR